MSKLNSAIKQVSHRPEVFIMNSFKTSMRRSLADNPEKACIIGHSFIRRLIERWQKEQIPLPDFSFDAFGTGGLKLPALLNIISSNDFSMYRAVFIQAGENDVMERSMAQNKQLLLQIYDELKRQGVGDIAFGELFPRHDRQFNRRVTLLNKVLMKIHPEKVWRHGAELTTTYAIRCSDGTHLTPEMEPYLSDSIENAVMTMRQR